MFIPRLTRASSGIGICPRRRLPPKNTITNMVRWAASPQLSLLPSSRRIFKPSRALPGVLPQRWSIRTSAPAIRNRPVSAGSRLPERTILNWKAS